MRLHSAAGFSVSVLRHAPAHAHDTETVMTSEATTATVGKCLVSHEPSSPIISVSVFVTEQSINGYDVTGSHIPQM